MSKIFVFGHKNPDTDSVCSAIAYADFKDKIDSDNEYEAVILGEINPETKFVLEKFGFEVPKVLKSVGGKKVILVDHNHMDQTADGIERAEIMEIIDHHNIADVQTGQPIMFHAEPVGCTATIIADFYFYHKVRIDKNIAGILLASILSDTVIFKSSTCTEKDKQIAEKLAGITEMNMEKFGMELKRKGADISKRKMDNILSGDFKVFDMKGKKVAVSQIELVETKELKAREKEIRKEGEKIAKKYDLFCFMATDIMKKSTDLYIFGNKQMAERAFGKKGDILEMKNMISRKKDVVPKLKKAYEE